MYAENALFFPHSAIAALRTLRGAEWQTLVERVLSRSETHQETLAFMLTIIRLNGCAGCETDSFRAMRGCAACAVQTLRRFKGSDQDLLDLFAKALADVQGFVESDPRAPLILDGSAA